MTLFLLAASTATAAEQPHFSASVSILSKNLRAEMTGLSWHPGCPVPLDRLRLIDLTYYGFDGLVHHGRLVVNRDVSTAIVSVFRRLYQQKFPIRRIELIDRYQGNDYASIEADNTSAFNCRPVANSTRWSQHAYGRAIDVNPIENPYVYSSGTSSHRASRPYLDRSTHRPGMAYEHGALVEAFDKAGWSWGGRWPGATTTNTSPPPEPKHRERRARVWPVDQPK